MTNRYDEIARQQRDRYSERLNRFNARLARFGSSSVPESAGALTLSQLRAIARYNRARTVARIAKTIPLQSPVTTPVVEPVVPQAAVPQKPASPSILNRILSGAKLVSEGAGGAVTGALADLIPGQQPTSGPLGFIGRFEKARHEAFQKIQKEPPKGVVQNILARASAATVEPQRTAEGSSREFKIAGRKFSVGTKGAAELVGDVLIPGPPVGKLAKGVKTAVRGIAGAAKPVASAAAAATPRVGEQAALKAITRLRSANTILRQLDNPNLLGRLAERAHEIGPLSFVAKHVNPAPLLAKTPLGRSLLVHSVQRTDAPSQIVEALIPFRGKRIPFTFDEAGNITDDILTGVKVRGRTPVRLSVQVMEDAFLEIGGRRVYKFTPEQEAWIRAYQQLFSDGAALMRENGVKFSEVFLEGAAENASGSTYIGRFVRELRDVSEETRLGARRGRSGLRTAPGITKRRSYLGQEIAEAVKNGVVYETDLLKGAESFLGAAYRAAADQQLINRVKKLAVRTIKTTEEVQAIRAAAAGVLKEERTARRLVNAVKQAKRGYVAGGTMAAIRKLFPQEADMILAARKLATKKAKTAAERKAARTASKEALDGLLARARTILKEKAAASRAIRQRVSATTERARLPREGEAVVRGRGGFPLANLKDNFFTPEDVSHIESALGLVDPNVFENTILLAGQLGDVSRVLRAGFDFGAPLLQGLPLLARNIAMAPVRLARGRIPETSWARATAMHYLSFLTPKPMQRHLLENAAHVREMVQHGVPLSRFGSDYFAALDSDALLPKILASKPLNPVTVSGRQVGVGSIVANILTRAENAFDAFGDYIRIEMWKSLRNTAAKKGPEGLDDLAAFIRNATGSFAPGAIGIKPTQQAVEKAWIFFSPRYTRASLALVADAFQGGLRGSEARKTMLSLASAGLGMYYLTSRVLGQEPVLNPLDSRFMTVKVGGERIGPGTFWLSFVRFVGKTLNKSVTDPGALASISSRDNPILGWLRGRSSPAGGFAWDIATGADFLGNRLETPIDWTKYVVHENLPFALEAAVMQQPTNAGAKAVTGELLGARTFPVPLSERRNILREQYAQAQYHKSWDDLNKLQKQTLEKGFVDLGQATEALRSQRVLRGEEIDRQVEGFFNERDRINQAWEDKIDAALQEMQRPGTGLDLPKFREDVLAKENANRRAEMEQLNTLDQFKPVLEYLRRLPSLGNPERPEDVAYNMFITMYFDPQFDGPEGVDFQKRDKAIEQFRAVWGDQVMGYIQARFDAGHDVPPLVQELYKGRDRFRYYWDEVPKRTIAARPHDSEEVQALYDQWRNATEIDRKALEETHPNLRNTLRTIDSVRAKLRELRPDLDAFLYRWGYTGTLKAPANEGREDDLRQPLPMDNYDPPFLDLAPGQAA